MARVRPYDRERQVTMIRLAVPRGRSAERDYAAEFVLSKLLGQKFTSYTHEGKSTVITVAGSKGSVAVADRLLATPEGSWLNASSLPSSPLKTWNAAAELDGVKLLAPTVPVLFGSGAPWVTRNEDDLRLNLDVFGSSFFLLTRYEELVVHDRDEHERFPAKASLALREGFLQRPLLDEYAEILWACLERVWPGLERPGLTGSVRLSHDVDWPLSPPASLRTTVRAAAGDVLVRKSPSAAATRLRAWVERRRGLYANDPNNTFATLMDVSEQHGTKSAFYFIAGRSAGAIDGDYDLDDPWMRSLLREIYQRGHEIGLHPSYGTYRDPSRIAQEFERLLSITSALGIEQPSWGGRQHYLRWEVPTTWRAWASAGLDYDSSVGYADHVGFRSGTCHDHRVFDVARAELLPLVERPLIAMEGTLLDNRYMALDLAEAVKTAVTLANVCARFGGNFNFLWHNSSFTTPRHHRAYQAIVGMAHQAYGSSPTTGRSRVGQ